MDPQEFNDSMKASIVGAWTELPRQLAHNVHIESFTLIGEAKG
jgi:hypothetical protein